MKHLEKAEAINQRESQHIPGVHVGFMMMMLLLLLLLWVFFSFPFLSTKVGTAFYAV